MLLHLWVSLPDSWLIFLLRVFPCAVFLDGQLDIPTRLFWSNDYLLNATHKRANGILHQLPSGSQLTCNLSQDWPNLLATFYSADDCQAEQPVLTTRLHASLAFSSLSHPFLSVQNVLSPSLSLLLHHCYKSKAKSQPKCTWLPLVFHLPHDWKLSVSSYSLSTFSVLW